MDGNPISLNPGWSIGGPGGGQNLLGNLGGLLGTPQGISGSHNKYETDSSPTRGDLYQYGNDYSLQMTQFKHLYGLQKDAANPNYNLDVMLQHRKWMFEQSVANNPYFFYGPFTGVLVSQAAFTFVYRFMSNKSAEAPEGVLNKEVLKSFFSITGPDDKLVHTPGHEKIPDNFYKRAIGDEYTINFFQLDILDFAAQYPRILDVGGNTGTKNSFAGVDILALTNGVYNSASLLKGNNLACFLYQNAQLGAPDAIKGLYTDTTKALSVLTAAIAPILEQFDCPALKSIDSTQFSKFPGATKSYSGYTPVVKREESFTA
jgi:Peroxidase, family 2